MSAPRSGRLIGAQTAYAIRFRPAEGVERPGNEALFLAIREAVERRVRASPARGAADRASQRIWCENGGTVRYVAAPESPDGGRLEAGTPECRGPRELLVYQKAQDRLLADAAADALAALSGLGVTGELSLLKSCRDLRGRTSGTQETYEGELASGAALFGWRLGMLGAIGLAALTAGLQWLARALVWAGLVAVGSAAFVAFLAAVTLGVVRQATVDRWSAGLRGGLLEASRAEAWGIEVTSAPLRAWVTVLAALFAFHRYRRPLLGFLATRAVLSGAGTLHPDGTFGLSEKGPAARRLFGWASSPDERALFEIDPFLAPLLAIARLDLRGVPGLFGRRQRMQLGWSDANLCETAEYLKIGTTSLVLDLAESGRLADAPRLADPLGAVQVTGTDPTMLAWVALENGGTMRVIDLQRYYWQRAVDWLADAEAPPLEAHRIVDLWGRTLAALESHPETLFGQLDWVTKRELLSQAAELPWAARKKIDLRYHELGSGYHQWLDDAGYCAHLVDEDEVLGARRQPPGSGPAAERAERVRSVAPPLPAGEASAPASPSPSSVIDFAAARARRRPAGGDPSD